MHRIKKHIGTHHINTWKTFLLVMTIIVGGTLGYAYSIHAYPEIFQTSVKMKAYQKIDPREPILIEFSHPVTTAKYDSETKMIPAADFNMVWRNNNRTLAISPRKFWKPETTYAVILPESTSALFTRVASAKFFFSTVDFPKVTKIYPEDGSKNVTLDIEDPMTVIFDKPLGNFFLNVDITPSSDVTYQYNEDRTEFKLLPKEKLKEGTDYQISIFLKYADDSNDGYKEIQKSVFSTLPPPPTSWEKDFAARVEQARRYTGARIGTGKYIDINLDAQILSTFENGKLLTANLISSGKRGMDTPKGQFAIKNKAPRPWSKKYGLFMPFWMAVASDGSFGIHELPEWPGGYKEGANHLGIPVSHGCIRLGIGPAKQIYEWTEVGTPVVIY